MLQFIKDLPDHVVGIYATGEVSKDDYINVLEPRMDELVKRQGKVNYLFVFETNLQNFTLAAWWEDFKVAFKNFTKWKKVAIVTDQKSVEWLSDAFTHFIPCESRGYKLSELNEAIKWVSENGEDFMNEGVSVDTIKKENELRSSNKEQGPAGENL
jgi:hypothetical protein